MFRKYQKRVEAAAFLLYPLVLFGAAILHNFGAIELGRWFVWVARGWPLAVMLLAVFTNALDDPRET
jgi:hypothetical protein